MSARRRLPRSTRQSQTEHLSQSRPRPEPRVHQARPAQPAQQARRPPRRRSPKRRVPGSNWRATLNPPRHELDHDRGADQPAARFPPACLLPGARVAVAGGRVRRRECSLETGARVPAPPLPKRPCALELDVRGPWGVSIPGVREAAFSCISVPPRFRQYAGRLSRRPVPSLPTLPGLPLLGRNRGSEPEAEVTTMRPIGRPTTRVRGIISS